VKRNRLLSRSDIREVSIRSQETRLRHKRSHVPCNLVNFISVNRESEVGPGRQLREEKTRQKIKGVKSEKPQRARKRIAGGWDQLPPSRIQQCPAMSGRLSLCAGVELQQGRSPAARRQGGEQEGGEDHVLPFYRGICACAEHVHICAVPAMRAARLNKSILARPCATLCASAFLQVVVAVSFQRSARDDNGNVETKPVCSGLLQLPRGPTF